jgi:hypothetical protein
MQMKLRAYRVDDDTEKKISKAAHELKWNKSQVVRECLNLGVPLLLLRRRSHHDAEAWAKHVKSRAGTWAGKMSGEKLLKLTRP